MWVRWVMSHILGRMLRRRFAVYGSVIPGVAIPGVDPDNHKNSCTATSTTIKSLQVIRRYPETRISPSAGLLLDQRRRRWSNSEPALGERFAFPGMAIGVLGIWLARCYQWWRSGGLQSPGATEEKTNAAYWYLIVWTESIMKLRTSRAAPVGIPLLNLP